MKVGNKQIIFAKVAFIPDGEHLEFEHQIAEDDFLRCRLRFVFDANENEVPSQPNLPRFSWLFHEAEGWFDLTFSNFIHPFGASIAPVVFALTNKRQPISIAVNIFKLAGMSKIEFQISVNFSESMPQQIPEPLLEVQP